MAQVKWCHYFDSFAMCGNEMLRVGVDHYPDGSRTQIWRCASGHETREPLALSHDEIPPTQRNSTVVPAAKHCGLCGREGYRGRHCKAMTCGSCGVWIAGCGDDECEWCCDGDDGPKTQPMRVA